MASLKNPYRPVDPDMEDRFEGREWVITSLDSYLLNVTKPLCVSVVAERGIGGKATVRKYLQLRKAELSLRIVECDLKGWSKGENAADFYRKLVQSILPQLTALSPEIRKVTNRLGNNKSSNLYEIEDDFWQFFELLREQNPSMPLLIVFYYFDELPELFHFEELDWTFLRQLHEQFATRLYYLIVSRRLLKYIEKLHGLEHSHFSTLFQSVIRIGLLEHKDTSNLSRKPAQVILNNNPWDEWLEDLIIEWSGGNPHCVQTICFHLFSQIWIQGRDIAPNNIDHLSLELGKVLRPHFDRLLDNLSKDKLIEVLKYMLESGYSASHHDQIEQLIDLGYFLYEPAQNKEYRLFSPLFHDYLVQRGVLSPAISSECEDKMPVVISPKVQTILNQPSSQELRLWQQHYFQKRNRIQEKPDTDEYVLRFLTGYEQKLSVMELQELRRCLLDKYFDERHLRNDSRTKDAQRAYLYAECDRWLKRYKEDESF